MSVYYRYVYLHGFNLGPNMEHFYKTIGSQE